MQEKQNAWFHLSRRFAFYIAWFYYYGENVRKKRNGMVSSARSVRPVAA